MSALQNAKTDIPSARGGWQEIYAIRPVKTIDGKSVCGPVMRRVEYREMTDEETANYQSGSAW